MRELKLLTNCPLFVNLYICIHIHMYICAYVYVCVYIIYVYIYTCVCICIVSPSHYILKKITRQLYQLY